MATKTSSKKSPILFVGIFIVVVLLITAYFFLAPKSEVNESMGDDNNSDSGLVGSIKDALSKSVSLKCTYTDTEGYDVISYIKNGAIRSDTTGESKGSVIMKDNTTYIWEEGATEGMKMTYNPEDFANSEEDTQDIESESAPDVVDQLEQYKDKCQPAVVEDSLFVPPADVEFVDYSEMMMNLQKSQPVN